MNAITKELLEALKPFAAFFDAVEHMGGTYPKTGAVYSVTSHIGEHRELSVEDFRQAREIIAKAEAILAAPQPSDDGWIPWAGGERPVDTIVEVKLRNGGILMNYACVYDWRHLNDPVDIVAYRVVRQSEKTWG